MEFDSERLIENTVSAFPFVLGLLIFFALTDISSALKDANEINRERNELVRRQMQKLGSKLEDIWPAANSKD